MKKSKIVQIITCACENQEKQGKNGNVTTGMNDDG